MHDFHITVISPSKRHLDEIVGNLQGVILAANIDTIEGPLQQLASRVSQVVPDVLIVDSACDGRTDLEPLERLGQIYPNMAFIVLCEQQSPDFLIQAMRAGVREVLPFPASADALKAAVERIRHKQGFAPTRKGKVLAFISCKGGSGATFLASNLAYALAAQSGKKVALFDFNLQFGDALLFLSDQKPATTLADVARDIHRLDAAMLASSMVNVGLNLSVLAAPEDPAHGMEVKPEHIDTLLKLARNQYDFVILDVGRNLDAQTIKALDNADMIFPVLQITLPFIRDGKRLLDVFRTLDYPKDKVHLVVNRFEKGGDIGLSDLEQSLGCKVERTIPNHFEAAAASVNQGIPVARLARSSPITKALNEWSEQLAREPEQAGSSWISRVFKRA
ncbi:AAA family ATPase [Herminiimonas sp. CN]|uniref:AAA family ATPase n=1 Tax=Herminiimonas sp. CN TaxID=1349818 RepID=UPI0005554981|nr:AAA family ATPase [Herminiimonas sp. CN]